LSRTISLYARVDVLKDMPQRMADLLRPLLQTQVAGPAIAQLPWLSGHLKVL